MTRTVLLISALALSSVAHAEDAPACNTLDGWNDSCDAAAAVEVVGLAMARLNELGDCSQHKKKPDLAACAAEATTLGNTLASAATSLEKGMRAAAATAKSDAGGEAKGGKAQRGNANRMEAEETDE